MKQYISAEQLEELSKYNMKMLYEIIPNPFLFSIAYNHSYTNQDLIEASHAITIGKLIEFLGKLGYQVNTSSGRPDANWVELNKKDFDELYDADELIDALWNTVKSVLPK